MGLLVESYLTKLAGSVAPFQKTARLQESKSLGYGEKFDVFLSHSYQDRDLILGVRLLLEQAGLSVYVDWINDGKLHHGHVTKENAGRIRERMRESRSLLYVHTPHAPDSKWMPWELGFMDAFTKGRCAIAPVFRDNAPSEFHGQEYLGLYPYLDLTGSSLFIHTSTLAYAYLREWLNGTDPTVRS